MSERRPNRRGVATRQAILEAALATLASGTVSANQVAKAAGATWGAVQYQFGDADGLWAAVLALLEQRRGTLDFIPAPGDSLAQTVARIVDVLSRGLATPDALAIDVLRAGLPRDRAELEAGFPLTAAALAAWNQGWVRTCESAFAPLTADPERIREVASLVPGAIRGLTAEAQLSTYVDIDAARRALAGSITAYLAG